MLIAGACLIVVTFGVSFGFCWHKYGIHAVLGKVIFRYSAPQPSQPSLALDALPDTST